MSISEVFFSPNLLFIEDILITKEIKGKEINCVKENSFSSFSHSSFSHPSFPAEIYAKSYTAEITLFSGLEECGPHIPVLYEDIEKFLDRKLESVKIMNKNRKIEYCNCYLTIMDYDMDMYVELMQIMLNLIIYNTAFKYPEIFELMQIMTQNLHIKKLFFHSDNIKITKF